MKKDKILGIIGGLGPLATAYFMELITEMTDAQVDQDHLEMIIHSAPAIPDRTLFITYRSTENPLPQILEIGKNLIRQGVGCIAIPCMTAHYFYDIMDQEFQVPVIHAIQATTDHLKQAGIRTAGIMATDGTIRKELFQEKLQASGITPIVPDAAHQATVMSLIYDNVKAGRPLDLSLFDKVSSHLREQGAEAIILGCTELSMAKRQYQLVPGYLDSMEVLAQQCILACGKPLKPKYNTLIS